MSELYNVYLNNFEALPLVSVIIPAYNAEKFITATLKSVLSQTYQKIEVIIVDDGSKDKTVEIVREFAAKDNRIILLQQSNSGVAAARNLAINKSRGEYIAPIDADDIWYTQKLEKQVQCMLQASPSVGLVYTWTSHIDEDGLLTGTYHKCNQEGNVLTTMFCEEPIGNASVPLIRRSCLDKVGLYDASLKEQNAQGLEDFDIYLRIAEHYEFKVVPDFLVGYRQVFGSMSRNTSIMAKSYELVVEKIRFRHPEIDKNIYDKHRGEMYYWFAFLSKQSGDHLGTISWLFQALLLNPGNLLQRPMLYKTFILAIFYILVQPISSLFWTSQSWYEFKKKYILRRNTSLEIGKNYISS